LNRRRRRTARLADNLDGLFYQWAVFVIGEASGEEVAGVVIRMPFGRCRWRA